jgi:glycosyltransferase involved in cell wall biosynthesis
MKVGVFLGKYSPDVGGGYTFQQEICRAIETFGSASRHKFVFFTNSPGVPEEASAGSSLRFITITNDHDRSHFSKLCQGAARFLSLVIPRWARIKFIDRIADPTLEHIRKESIDVTWSLTPAYLSTAVPFITTVWDLEHRLQPYFPEVSLGDEWDGREKGYSELLGKAYVITGTETGKVEIEKFYHVPGERIKVLPLPTPQFISPDILGYDNILQQKYGLPDTYLLYPAQFWPHKNHYGLLMGLQTLREKYNLILPVVFVGSDMGNLAYIIKVVGDLGLAGQVHFLGFVPRDHLATLYRNAFALLYFLVWTGQPATSGGIRLRLSRYRFKCLWRTGTTGGCGVTCGSDRSNQYR